MRLKAIGMAFALGLLVLTGCGSVQVIRPAAPAQPANTELAQAAELARGLPEGVSVQTRAAGTRAGAAAQVQASLEAQRAAVSGVSIDEESINLLNYQRQYQAAAQLISTVDELTQILLSLV